MEVARSVTRLRGAIANLKEAFCVEGCGEDILSGEVQLSTKVQKCKGKFLGEIYLHSIQRHKILRENPI